jgi:AraC-like DNA-binding protein
MRDSRAPRPHLPPSAMGGISRLAYAYAEAKGVDADKLLLAAGLMRKQIEDPDSLLHVKSQIAFLNLVAEAVDDDLLGFHLAQNFEMRAVGLLYYVFASSATLEEALLRGARYSLIVNEGIRLKIRRGKSIGFVVEYVGVPRRLDRQQIEFWIVTLLRVCRQITKRDLTAERVGFVHRRNATPELRAFFGCDVKFGAAVDEVLFPPSIRNIAVASADPYLNQLLVQYCEQALAHKKAVDHSFGMRIENAIAVLLPHGKAQASEVARKLGMSQRTLARRLAAEGLTFAGVLRGLRSNLANRHLADNEMSISRIAWLLGYQDISAFTNAFKRWHGRTPRAVRQRA